MKRLLLLSAGTAQAQPQITDAQAQAADSKTERHEMLLCPPPSRLRLLEDCLVLFHTRGTTEGEKWIGLKVRLNKKNYFFEDDRWGVCRINAEISFELTETD